MPCVSKAFVDAKSMLADVDAIAVSAGPGLAGCPAVGVRRQGAGLAAYTARFTGTNPWIEAHASLSCSSARSPRTRWL